MIQEKDFNAKQHELADLMSEVSEDSWCAGWMTGNEYYIWEALVGLPDNGRINKDCAQIMGRIRSLATELRGWVIWNDAPDPDSDCGSDVGLCFVSMHEWSHMVRPDKKSTKQRKKKV